MKSVLISIQPQWCELIASGKKTIEVRKSAPKEVPFKAYIYMTATKERCRFWEYITAYQNNKGDILNGSQKVIGEVICDKVYKFEPDGEYYTYGYDIDDDSLEETCLTREDLTTYGKGKTLYGWHISDLKIYDKPKELGEFYTICNKYGDDSCGDCPYLAVEQCSFPCDDCVDTWCSVDNIKPITRPPQSWCRVEELQ